jgi:hypothetical protein
MLIEEFRLRNNEIRNQHSAICNQTVSPFDGVNRIRFKGSPSIADFRFAIAD